MSSARWRRTRSWTGPAPRRGSRSGVPDLSLQALAAQAFTGLVLGGILVLLAIGLSLIFGLMAVVNFAHGSLYMLGAYFGFFISASPAASGRLCSWPRSWSASSASP